MAPVGAIARMFPITSTATCCRSGGRGGYLQNACRRCRQGVGTRGCGARPSGRFNTPTARASKFLSAAVPSVPLKRPKGRGPTRRYRACQGFRGLADGRLSQDLYEIGRLGHSRSSPRTCGATPLTPAGRIRGECCSWWRSPGAPGTQTTRGFEWQNSP